MKQKLKPWIITAVCILYTFVAFAQDESPTRAKWASDKGYWIVENNIKDPLNHIIWFYNNDDVLLYKETLSGIRLNLDKKKVKIKLKKILEATVIAWEKNKIQEENKDYVMSALR